MKNSRWKLFALLYALNFVVLFSVSLFQDAPSYMDASYYFSGAIRLAEGAGFTENVLWNYLDNPVGLPHPSHAYWQPLTSIIAFVGIKIFSFLHPFKGAQLILIFLGAAVAPLTAYLAELIFEKPEMSVMFHAGMFAVFSGFYLPFLSTTDAFSIYMIGGGLFCVSLIKQPRWLGLGLGLVTGWMYLARADGLIWFGVACLAVLLLHKSIRRDLIGLGVGFLGLAGPWLVRNFFVWGSWRAPGGRYLLWQLTYDDIFSFPPEIVSYERWRIAGFEAWFSNWGSAMFDNFQSLFAVQGLMILTPFIVFGLWLMREKIVIKMSLLAWGLTAIVMTFVFPLAGPRGGFFHSGAALMPLFWVMAVIGLRQFAPIVGQLPRWSETGAWLLLRVVTLVGVIGLSVVIAFQAISNQDTQEIYKAVELRLIELGAEVDSPILINDAPSYHATTQRPALVTPNGDEMTLLAVAEKFNVGYLLLEKHHVVGLDDLFSSPQDRQGLDYIETFHGIQIYRIVKE